MSTKNNPHNQAMDLVETAILERTRGNTERTNQLYAQALELEERNDLAEPTWSVLHRSTGWMAFNSNQPRLAEKLACKALGWQPPPGNCRGTAGLAGASPRPDGPGKEKWHSESWAAAGSPGWNYPARGPAEYGLAGGRFTGRSDRA